MDKEENIPHFRVVVSKELSALHVYSIKKLFINNPNFVCSSFSTLFTFTFIPYKLSDCCFSTFIVFLKRIEILGYFVLKLILQNTNLLSIFLIHFNHCFMYVRSYVIRTQLEFNIHYRLKLKEEEEENSLGMALLRPI